MTDYNAILFDNDGVLVQPPKYRTQVAATRAAFRSVGVENPSDAHVDDIVSGPTVDRLRTICAVYGVDVRSFWKARERFDEEAQFEQFERGDRCRYDDVTAIDSIPQPCGVVSNNHHSTIEFVLEKFDLQSLFETYYGREKTVESLELKKPNTHYLERALSDLGGGPALYIGDKESDIIAANRAGMDSVFVNRPHNGATERSTTPTYEVDTLGAIADIATGRQ